MPQAVQKPVFDAQTYLEWEAGQEEKHEYHRGEVFAMAGASDAHVTIAGNLYMALRQHLRGKPCGVYISDMKLRVAADDAFYYPDVFVSCSADDRAQRLYKSEPLLVAEVLSASTAAFDRGYKFASYRKLGSLREYLLIDSERESADLFTRDAQGRWVLDAVTPGGVVRLDSVALELPLEQLYEAVDWDDTGGTSGAGSAAPA